MSSDQQSRATLSGLDRLHRICGDGIGTPDPASGAVLASDKSSAVRRPQVDSCSGHELMTTARTRVELIPILLVCRTGPANPQALGCAFTTGSGVRRKFRVCSSARQFARGTRTVRSGSAPDRFSCTGSQRFRDPLAEGVFLNLSGSCHRQFGDHLDTFRCLLNGHSPLQ